MAVKLMDSDRYNENIEIRAVSKNTAAFASGGFRYYRPSFTFLWNSLDRWRGQARWYTSAMPIRDARSRMQLKKFPGRPLTTVYACDRSRRWRRGPAVVRSPMAGGGVGGGTRGATILS